MMLEMPLSMEKHAVGIELGSTRIKTVLIGADNTPIASEAMTGKTVMSTIFGHTA